MRSTRSLASVKSVTIDPEVTEYHYNRQQTSVRQETRDQDLLGRYEVYPPPSSGAGSFSLPRTRRETLEASVDFRDEDEERGREEEENSNSRGEGETRVPSPVYPTLPLSKDWKSRLSPRLKGFTKDEIIGYYCQPDKDGDVLL